MAIELQPILEEVKESKPILEYNKSVFEILEGNLNKYLELAIDAQNTGNSRNLYKQRSAPINILKKVFSKLSKLYANEPERRTELPSDQELVDHYVQSMNLDGVMADANLSFNAYKATNVEIFEDEGGKLLTRSLPAFKYVPYSSSQVNPMRLTEMVKIMQDKIWIYSDEDFLAVTDGGEMVAQDMRENMGENPFGIIPFVYRPRSQHLLQPIPDRDVIKMAILIPILLGDINTASQFLSAPILYGVDVDVDNLQKQPNVFWNVKSSDATKAGSLGVLKPEPDIDGQLQLIKEELALWLQSKNIKPAAIGTLTVESAASGISLMIQEMDTTEDRQEQASVFEGIERELWQKIATMHNALVQAGRLPKMGTFSDPETLEVKIDYGSMAPVQTEAEKEDSVLKRLAAGTLTKEQAVKRLEPDFSDVEIAEVIDAGEKRLTINLGNDNGEEVQDLETQEN